MFLVILFLVLDITVRAQQNSPDTYFSDRNVGYRISGESVGTGCKLQFATIGRVDRGRGG